MTEKMTLNRRRVLQVIAGGGAAASLFSWPLGAGGPIQSEGYGPDPDMNNPEVTWDKSLTEVQLKVITIIADFIIPADDTSPAASALDIPDFINEWVSAPYPDQQKDRAIILGGLALLNDLAKAQGAPYYLALTEDQQLAIFDGIAEEVKQQSSGVKLSYGGSATESPKTNIGADFFGRMVFLTVGGFYTTEEGMEDIGYVGNVALSSFDGPPAEIIEKVGL